MADYKVVDAEKLDAELKSLADKIREKGGTAEELDFYEGDFTNAVGAIESGGGGNTDEIENLIDHSGVLGTTDETVTVMDKVEQLIDKAEDENLWYELSKNSLYLGQNLFREYDGTTLPRLNLEKTESMNYFLTSSKNIVRIDNYLNSASCKTMLTAFGATTNLKYMKGVNTSSCTNANGLYQNSGIEEIEIPFDFSKVTSCTNAFACSYLRKIRFVEETINKSIAILSPVLTIGNVFNLNDTENVGSVQSIINGLATIEAVETLTLSKNLPLTEEQKQAITTAVNSKGWSLAFM